jgi:hypothetical protein
MGLINKAKKQSQTIIEIIQCIWTVWVLIIVEIVLFQTNLEIPNIQIWWFQTPEWIQQWNSFKEGKSRRILVLLRIEDTIIHIKIITWINIASCITRRRFQGTRKERDKLHVPNSLLLNSLEKCTKKMSNNS